MLLQKEVSFFGFTEESFLKCAIWRAEDVWRMGKLIGMMSVTITDIDRFFEQKYTVFH